MAATRAMALVAMLMMATALSAGGAQAANPKSGAGARKLLQGFDRPMTRPFYPDGGSGQFVGGANAGCRVNGAGQLVTPSGAPCGSGGFGFNNADAINDANIPTFSGAGRFEVPSGNGNGNGRGNGNGNGNGRGNGNGNGNGRGNGRGRARRGVVADLGVQQIDPSDGLPPSFNAPRNIGGRPVDAAPTAFTTQLEGQVASNPSAAAPMIANAGRNGKARDAAEGLVNSARRGRRSNVAASLADAAALNRAGTVEVLDNAAALAAARGETQAFADTAAEAFTVAKRRGKVAPFSMAVTESITKGGVYGQYTYGQAIGKAIASGADGAAAVAEATATAFCAGDSYASAWAAAYSVALSQDSRGCLVLNQARAIAVATCGGGAFNANVETSATSNVLGFCGLLPDSIDMSWSGGNTGSNAGNIFGRRLAGADSTARLSAAAAA